MVRPQVSSWVCTTAAPHELRRRQQRPLTSSDAHDQGNGHTSAYRYNSTNSAHKIFVNGVVVVQGPASAAAFDRHRRSAGRASPRRQPLRRPHRQSGHRQAIAQHGRMFESHERSRPCSTCTWTRTSTTISLWTIHPLANDATCSRRRLSASGQQRARCAKPPSSTRQPTMVRMTC